MAKAEKKKSLDEILKELDKKYGNKAVIHGNEIEKPDIVISTGSLSLDIATGIGGIPLSTPEKGNGKIIEIRGWESTGKAQPLNSKILTPYGWKQMKDMEVGSIISTPDGNNTTVIAIHPQGLQDVYKITFDDKTFTYCTLDHLWFVNSRRSTLGEVLKTKELLEKNLRKKKGSRNFKIPTVNPIIFDNDKKLIVDPYLLGLLIGDGGLTHNSVKITLCDEELVDKVKAIIEEKYDNLCLSNKMGECGFNFKKKISGKTKHELYSQLEKLKLLGKYSYEKHIPSEYLLSSIEDRIALLQGLMDSNGSVEKGTLSFSSSSKKLSEDFQFLCRSLGARVSTSSRETKYKHKNGNYVDGRTSYRSSILLNTNLFMPFRLTRKINEFNSEKKSTFSERFIESIEYSHKDICQCITVGSPEQLYITDDFIVTHNSSISQTIIGNAQKKGIKVLLVDSENSIDEDYAKTLGIDLEKLYLIQLDEGAGEAAYDKMLMMVETGEIGLVVVDSYNALQPKKIVEDGLESANMGLHARMMSKLLAKCNQQCSQNGTTFIFCGQLRQAIGIMWGSNEVTQGGNSLKFYIHMGLETTRSTTNDNSLYEEGDKTGNKSGNLHKVKIYKNKLAAPFRKAEFYIEYGKGINQNLEILELGKEYEVLKRRVGIITYNENKYEEEDFIKLLSDNPEFKEEIRNKIINKAKTIKVEPEINIPEIVDGLANDLNED